jgi:uncharacterized protein YyaL (SSP411 family)
MTNRLAAETSPYLQQHANNPVDWQPWDEQALTLARRQGKPILLSVGYSACHWCHVMAHESFEDPEVAAAMNADFVNIKVDREERPDLDQIYQTAHALLTRRSGGWPLTMFSPGWRAVFRGTYFPREGRYGLPGFLELLPRIAAAYREQGPRSPNRRRGSGCACESRTPNARRCGSAADGAGISACGIEAQLDPEHGGFGAAPKFPHPTDLTLCLHAAVRDDDSEARTVVRVTLECMADGGIHDQLGGGFCRYSVDAEWMIPHFEKMLYDNGPLLGLYADFARVTGESRFTGVARDIVVWMTREMRAPDGAFSRASTPTAKARKVSSMSGRRTRFAACFPPMSSLSLHRIGASMGRQTSKVTPGTCVLRDPSKRSLRCWGFRWPKQARGSRARRRRCLQRGRSGCAPGSTTRS